MSFNLILQYSIYKDVLHFYNLKIVTLLSLKQLYTVLELLYVSFFLCIFVCLCPRACTLFWLHLQVSTICSSVFPLLPHFYSPSHPVPYEPLTSFELYNFHTSLTPFLSGLFILLSPCVVLVHLFLCLHLLPPLFLFIKVQKQQSGLGHVVLLIGSRLALKARSVRFEEGRCSNSCSFFAVYPFLLFFVLLNSAGQVIKYINFKVVQVKSQAGFFSHSKDPVQVFFLIPKFNETFKEKNCTFI